MPDLKTIVEENQNQRERLVSLMKALRESDYSRALPNGWTVGVALAHLAFWDLSQVARLKRWLQDDVKPSSLDAEAVNGPLAALSEALPPKAVVKLAAGAAEAIDRLVEQLTPEQVETLLGMGLERNLRRSVHRQNHLDKIEELLGKG